MPSQPLVSCLMPTHDRRRFVPRALRQFLGQDYENRELVIVDDGTDPIGDLVPEDPRIRYERRSKKMTLGAKRNLACETARGDILVHWDDDDWMASWRLTYQVRSLLDAGADVCGLDRLLFYDPNADKAWRYVYPAGGRPWVAGGTLCYTRAFWKRRPFEPIDVGEDNRFLFRSGSIVLERLEDERFYVALIHESNTSRKRTGGARWRAVDAAEVRSLLGKDGPPPRERSRTRPRRPSPAGDLVTVTIPYYRCGETLRRAVRSILEQTHEQLTLVVVNDGDHESPPWPLLDDFDDPRLVRFDLERNRGRYFVDAVAVAATSDPFYLIQDADDWSERHRLSTLLRRLKEEGTAGAVSAIRRVPRGSVPQAGSVERYRTATRPLTNKLIHRASHTGLFRTAALRAVGGYYGGFRIGYDTLLVSLLLMTDRLAYVDEPLYNCLLRQDSLTKSAETGMRSAARQETHRLLRGMYADAYKIYERFRRREIGREELEDEIRRICRRHVEPEAAAALVEESARLRETLAGREPAKSQPAKNQTAKSRPAKNRPAKSIPHRLADGDLPWSGWTLGREAVGDLRRHLDARQPRRILEVGSGTSTILLADCARRAGASLVTLEHDTRYFHETRGLLGRFGLTEHVDLKLAPLVPLPCPDGHSYPWYSGALSGPFDFVLIDGPPMRYGRQASLFAVFPHLASDGEVWLNDAKRAHEAACIELWSRHLTFDRSLVGNDPKGLFRLSRLETAVTDAPEPSMDPRHYILTNFNLARSFGEQPGSPPDEAWLDARFEIFERFCLPSVRAQRDQRFRWLLRFDPRTPERYLARVRELASNIEVVFEPFRQRIARDVSRGADFLIMSRLDNDDALHVDFTRYVRSRMNGETKVVDVRGYQLDVRDGRRDLYVGKYIDTHRKPTPFISLMTPASGDGFPMVDAHPHHEMGKHYPVDDSPLMYFLQIIHGRNASNKIVGRPYSGRLDLSQFGLS